MITVSFPACQVTLPDTTAHELLEHLQQALADSGAGTAPGANLTLHDEHPLWEQHSGLDGHNGPEWNAHGDLQEAEAFYSYVTSKAKVFLDLLIEHPGEQLDVEEICRLSNGVFTGSRSIAGAINGLLKPHRASGRRYPFYWWGGKPTRYSMKPSVAELFRRARVNLER